MSVFYIYILKSLKDERYYIGATSDITARLQYHNNGLQRSTMHRTPFVLDYSEIHPTKTAALKREKLIKSYKGGSAFKRLLSS